jgi:hypothetical protein
MHSCMFLYYRHEIIQYKDKIWLRVVDTSVTSAKVQFSLVVLNTSTYIKRSKDVVVVSFLICMHSRFMKVLELIYWLVGRLVADKNK